MKKSSFICLSIACTAFFLCSCEKEEDNNGYNYNPTTSTTPTTTKSTISKPEVSISSRKASGSYDGWWVIAKVTTGGDDPNNVVCYLEWNKYSNKQTGKISYSHKDKMNVQSTTKTQVLFKKEHAGINNGDYIYFRLVGKNSKYSTTGSASYMVAIN